MTDRSFDQLLYQGAAQLPPQTVGQDPPDPWRKALWRVCWGLALTTITLNFLDLQYILPALGSVLLYLGFRALRRENGWLRMGYGLSALFLLLRGVITILNATPLVSTSSGWGYVLGMAVWLCNLLLAIALWQGLKEVFPKAGQKPKTGAAGGTVLCYLFLFLLALVSAQGLLLWPIVLLWLGLLIGLFRVSRSLDQAGYAISPAPVRFSEQRVILVWLGLLLAAVLACLFLFRRYPVEATPAQLEPGQESLRAELVEMGFPEEILADLTDEEVALLEGAQAVDVESSDPQGLGYSDDLDRLAMRFVQVELPQERVRYFLWFSWEEAPDHRLQEGLEIQPNGQNALTMNYDMLPSGRLLWEEEGQLYQAPISGTYEGRTQNSIFFGPSTYNSFAFHFSLPARGERIRGYVSYEAYDAYSGWHIFNAIANYVHQESWLLYPWETPLQHQWRNWNNTDEVFPARQFLTMFTLNKDDMETE